MVEDIRQTFGQRLRTVREAAGLSAETLAERLNVHPNTVYRLERAEMWISAELLTAIVNEFQISPVALFGEPPEPTDAQIVAAIVRKFGSKKNETVFEQDAVEAVQSGYAAESERSAVTKKREDGSHLSKKGKHQ